MFLQSHPAVFPFRICKIQFHVCFVHSRRSKTESTRLLFYLHFTHRHSALSCLSSSRRHLAAAIYSVYMHFLVGFHTAWHNPWQTAAALADNDTTHRAKQHLFENSCAEKSQYTIVCRWTQTIRSAQHVAHIQTTKLQRLLSCKADLVYTKICNENVSSLLPTLHVPSLQRLTHIFIFYTILLVLTIIVSGKTTP